MNLNSNSAHFSIYWGLVIAQILGLGLVTFMVMSSQMNTQSQSVAQWRAIQDNQVTIIQIRQALDTAVADNIQRMTHIGEKQNTIMANQEHIIKMAASILEKQDRLKAVMRRLPSREALPMPKKEEPER